MKKYWQKLVSQVFWQDKSIVFGIVLMLVLNIAAWLLVARVERVEEFVPWHYTVYFGIDRVGPWWKMVLYPAFGSVVMLFNFFLVLGVYHKRRLFSYLILIITNIIQIFLLLEIWGLSWFII